MRSLKTYIILCLVCLLLSGAASAEDSKVPSSFKPTVIAEGLEHPWSLAFLPRGSYLVTERQGRLWRIYEDGRKVEVKGVPPVYNRGQGGLLDIVTEPGFKDNGYVYFSYAATDPDNSDIANTEVARARLSLTQNRLNDLQVIFKAEPKVEGSNHWGSRLLFAPDGTLFITLGERFDYKNEAQSPKNHLGTIVRINPDGSIPEDNPFADGEKGRPEVFSYGHRNPQGLALHPQSGEIWEHEHGPQGGDEINILKSGANYGWPAATFGISYWGFKISDETSIDGMEDSILHWTPSIAPSGMAFYTGDKFPEWKGDLFVGALAGQHLRRVELDGSEIIGQQELLTENRERIRDVRNGPDGYLYILTDQDEGRLIRLEP